MTRYRVYLSATASHSVEVEADNEADAMDLGEQQGPPSLCHQCARGVELGDFFANEENVETLS